MVASPDLKLTVLKFLKLEFRSNLLSEKRKLGQILHVVVRNLEYSELETVLKELKT